MGDSATYASSIQLLHKYGALLGLWASDHPYRGNTLQFRLRARGRFHVLVGEPRRIPVVWDDARQSPLYVECVQIGFGLTEDDDPDDVTVSFNLHAGMDVVAPYHKAEPWLPRLAFASAFHSPLVLHAPDHSIRDPDFPTTGTDRWYNSSHDRARLVVIPSVNEDNDVVLGESGKLECGVKSDAQESSFAPVPTVLLQDF